MGSMEGDGIRGKRRRPEGAVPGGPGELQDSEEIQVEKFFALLRSIGEMRGQLRRAGGHGAVVAGKRTKAEGSLAWTPTFQWEDFAVVLNNVDGAVPAASARGGGRRGKEKEEGEGTNLDLRLSL